jgi:hypothetical protein
MAALGRPGTCDADEAGGEAPCSAVLDIEAAWMAVRWDATGENLVPASSALMMTTPSGAVFLFGGIIMKLQHLA